MTRNTTPANKVESPKVIGGSHNFWLYSKATGYDITHPATPSAPKVYPRMTLQTQESPVTLDPTKTALVIIDLQNYFLSPALGRPRDSLGLQVVERLCKEAIPACRKAGIPILWLGWGLTEEDIDTMPPTITRGFAMDTNFTNGRKPPELGADMGRVTLDDGSKVEAGKALMRHTWNARAYTALMPHVQPGDIKAWKNRLSGLWGGTEVEEKLKARGIRTLLFAGCNLDQCVASSLMDAVWRNYDCLLLSDGTATTSPKFAREAVEYNMGGWGFLLSCKDLVDGADSIERK